MLPPPSGTPTSPTLTPTPTPPPPPPPPRPPAQTTPAASLGATTPTVASPGSVAITSSAVPTPAGGDGRRKRTAGLLAVLLIGLGLGIGALLIAQRDGGTDSGPLTAPDIEPSPDITPDDVGDIEAAVTVPVVPATTDATVPDTEPSASVGAEAEVVTDPDPAPTTQPPVQSTTTVLEVEEPVAEVVVPTTVAEPTPDAAVPDESVATVRNGQIFLEGAVPTQESGDAIAALAAEILGPDNVFNNYVIDPAAGDPNLGNVTVEDTINFATDSAALLDPNEPLLGQGLALMNIRPAMTVTIVGHTDSRGSVEGNKTLSLARAETVKAWFVDRGIDADRLTTAGAGDTEPISSNDTAAGRTENRRIQFFLENILGDT